MGHVGIAAIGAARCDDAQRWFVRLHGAHLDRRGMGAQYQLTAVAFAGKIEGVVHLAGGMFGRDIEGREIVEVVLNIGAFGHSETHLAEDGQNLV